MSKFRNILAIESAVAGGSIALIRDHATVGSRQEGNDCSRAEKIIPVIRDLLEESGLALSDLDLIAVSTGPGSYSGIRIGLSTALGLGNSLGIACRGVSVLAAMAAAVGFPGPVIVAVPVGKNDVAWQLFGPRDHEERKAIKEPELLSAIAFTRELDEVHGHALFAQSDLLKRIADDLPAATTCVDVENTLAELVGNLASLQDDAVGSLRPLYLRNRDTAGRPALF